ncbi:related to alkaline dihydroceramidase Ydc1 [Rhynchosporium secalis]|uniref:Related to alkaline dihydroceramidase Ydc1 n=1 Tax=Rhynchosporium secalis TaxID=38038 RepID=A0A1E1MBA0_RHYSE|nr:related to alkaline dihydroceramidase Ydc1 [Rhynchosporium secalis]
MSFLPSIPYPPASGGDGDGNGYGYWSPVTSTLNWCEEDYYLTTYAAEVVNSCTNLIFVFLAYKGIASCVRYGHDRVFLLGFMSYLMIGLGSIAFHMTLKYPMQLLDELAMIYTTSIMFYAIFSHNRSPFACTLLLTLTVGIAAFITLYYHYLQDPLFHQNMFALLTVIVVLRSMFVMERTLRPRFKPLLYTHIHSQSQPIAHSRSNGNEDVSLSVAEKKEEAWKEARDLAILGMMWKMIACGLTSVACGFLIWNLDNAYCSTLRRWRREVGLPWGVLLEGHGWWHIMTGIAAYFNLTWAVWLRYCMDGRQDEVELEWPSLWGSVPVVMRRCDGDGNAMEKMRRIE